MNYSSNSININEINEKNKQDWLKIKKKEQEKMTEQEIKKENETCKRIYENYQVDWWVGLGL